MRVLLSIRSDDLSANGTTAFACARVQDTGGEPFLRVDKGACGGSSPDQPWDVIVGDLRSLSDPLGTTPLGNIECVANDAAQDRVTLQTQLSNCRAAVFVLARKGAGQALSYGAASNGNSRYSITGDCP